jgi:hypothetical protein
MVGVCRLFTTVATLTPLLIAVLVPRSPLVAWSVAQIVVSVWPWPVAAVHEWEAWAWDQWQAAESAEPRPPLQVPELAIGAVPSDLSTPFIIRGLLNGSRALEGFGGPEWLLEPPVADLEVDFFSDASAKLAVVPNARGRLGDVVASIFAGGSQKIGTEIIFRRFPELLDALGVLQLLAPVFGGAHFRQAYLGSTLTVPVFVGRGSEEGRLIRTDLHCEPIGNAMLMLAGRKHWTLVSPAQSQVLRPSISPDGRAYFLSRLTGPPNDFAAHAVRYQVETRAGDVLWVPTWTWHRVDYVPGVSAVSASLFHFKAGQLAALNPLFAGLLLPNLAKELVGWKTQ